MHCTKDQESQPEVVMKVRDLYFAVAAILSALVLAGIISTEPYAAAAGAQAKGFDALAHQVFPLKATKAH
jgi:hypothetical protein